MSPDLNAIPGQPDGIEDDSSDMPDPARAAERILRYVEACGDGLYDAVDGHPLYGRDLCSVAQGVKQLADDVDERDSEISTLRQDLDLQTKAAWDNNAQVAQLQDELAKATGELGYATMQRDWLLVEAPTKVRQRFFRLRAEDERAKRQNTELAAEDTTAIQPCQPIGCDNGYHLAGCRFADIDAAGHSGTEAGQ